MSTTYIAAIVGILAVLLPRFGVEIGSEELTSLVSSIIAIGTGVWIMYQRTKLQKAPFGFGDVTALGVKR